MIKKSAKTKSTEPCKIVVDRAAFLPLLRLAVAVIPTHEWKPDLKNIKITANRKEGVILGATNMDTVIRITMTAADGATVIEEGQILLPADAYKMIGKSREPSLTVEGTTYKRDGDLQRKIVVHGASERYEFDETDPDKFPDVTAPVWKKPYVVKADDLYRALRRTIFAAGKDVLYPVYEGVCFSTDDKSMNLVATNGMRLAWQVVYPKEVYDQPMEPAVVPLVDAKLVEVALRDRKPETVVKMAFTANNAVFQISTPKTKGGTVTITTKLLAGKFPKWRKIIPDTAELPCIAVTQPKELLSALKNVSASLKPSDPNVTLTFKKKLLTITGKSEKNNVTLTVPLENDVTAVMQINPEHLILFLNALEKNASLLWYLPDDKDAVTVLCLQTTSDNEGAYTYVVMPREVSEPAVKSTAP